MRSNLLQLNADKTELMWCSSSRKLSQLPSCSFSVAGSLVCPVNAVRDLRVFIDNDLAAASHVRRTTSISLHFASFVDTSPTTASVPWWCHLCTRLDYGNLVLVGLPAYLQRRLQSVLNAAARLVFRLGRYEHDGRTLLQLYIGCVYHNMSTSRWPSWRFVCCHHTSMILFVSPADLPGRR